MVDDARVKSAQCLTNLSKRVFNSLEGGIFEVECSKLDEKLLRFREVSLKEVAAIYLTFFLICSLPPIRASSSN